MSRVKILPDIIINKIAAGEVVERPASIVKELVENSLDAGSTKISVEIEDGGKKLIRVSDNGEGMEYEDALLAVERHATSKIISDADLFSISTLGFRGEALPSIASISRFSIETRTKNSDSGVAVYINGGRILNAEDCGCAPGTTVTARDIFFNTPARRKFLRTSSTELAHITEIITCLSLPWPSVNFRLTADGRIVKNLPAVASPVERVVDILGKESRNRILYVEKENENITLSGWISEPDVSRGSGQKIFLFANGRYIRDRGIIHAICDAYTGSLMKGRFPVAVLFMDLPDGTVDVNVHPTKQEVRFTNQREIYSALRSACHEALMKREISGNAFQKPRTSQISSKSITGNQGSFIFSNRSSEAEPEKGIETDYNNSFNNNPLYFYENTGTSNNKQEPESIQEKPSDFGSRDTCSYKTGQSFTEQAETELSESIVNKESVPESKTPSIFSSLTVIGQLKNSYILCDSPSGLVIFDQHAAHERVIFEKLEKTLDGEKKPSVQKLLIPEIMELSPRETAAMLEMLPDLISAGIEIEHFGENSFAVRAVPAILPESQIKSTIHDLAEKAVRFSAIQTYKIKLYNECFSVMACHAAVRSGQKLAISEMENLLGDLSVCANPYHCPHGRPVYILVTADEMEKKFGRKG